MKTIGIFEAKTKLSEICEEVARTGRPAEISRRGKPLVRIVPLAEEDDSSSGSQVWDRVRKWEASHPDAENEEFEIPLRHSTDRDPLSNYWEE
jgi:prevent-host-death family protein